MLDWKLRVDGVICAEPFGLEYWYYIDNNQLRLVDNYGAIKICYPGHHIDELKLIAQEHYVRVLKHHI